MKSPDEIKKGLFCCWEDGCATCPYDDDCTMEANFEQLAKDALAYIQQLESRLAQVERERDAAVADLKDSGDCRYCKNLDLSDNCGFGNCCTCENDKCPCCKCDRKNDHFEWRGICAENTKEDAGENTEKA